MRSLLRCWVPIKSLKTTAKRKQPDLTGLARVGTKMPRQQKSDLRP